MTVTPSSPVVGIFKDRSMAEQSIDALHNAGFTSEQIRYLAPGASGSILADLKSLFTGQTTSGGNITNDLTDMGLSEDEAQYYANEYNNGNAILAISTEGREQEALNVLHQYGAYNARTSDSSPATAYSQQPFNSTQQTADTPDEAALQPHPAPTYEAQQQPSDVDDHPFQNTQQDVGDHPFQNAQQDTATSTADSEVQHAQQDVATSTADSEVQNYQLDEAPTVQDTEYEPVQSLPDDYRATPEVTSSPDAETPASTPASQATSSDGVVSDRVSAPQDTSTAAPTSEPTDEFEQLQEQLRVAQQQLQDARAQLQAA
ncbi:MAG: hypothetical protein JO011_06465, partial [Ktedonobacteraceae bacterium]|nr:hypothetical protein [Ktedonobacteraceae bacterium]